MLVIENLTKVYDGPAGGVRALDDVSLDVSAGQFLAVRGPSGCGKSTLLLSAGGLLAPTEGVVHVDGHELYAMAPEVRARWRATAIGFVFQQFHLLPYLDVLQNVSAPSWAAHGSELGDRAEALIAQFGLSHRMRHLPSELSTGERQRAALARALLHEPKLLLADEPTGNLDESNAEIVLEHLAEFARRGGAVLLVTHDARAAGYAGRTIHLDAGRIVKQP